MPAVIATNSVAAACALFVVVVVGIADELIGGGVASAALHAADVVDVVVVGVGVDAIVVALGGVVGVGSVDAGGVVALGGDSVVCVVGVVIAAVVVEAVADEAGVEVGSTWLVEVAGAVVVVVNGKGTSATDTPGAVIVRMINGSSARCRRAISSFLEGIASRGCRLNQSWRAVHDLIVRTAIVRTFVARFGS